MFHLYLRVSSHGQKLDTAGLNIQLLWLRSIVLRGSSHCNSNKPTVRLNSPRPRNDLELCTEEDMTSEAATLC